MTAARLNNEAMFHTARDIPDPDRRQEYVREACGGDEARIAEVTALLAAAEAPDSLLDRPIGNGTQEAISQPTAENPGAVIGPYKLIEQIGEGGMGTVWMAQQTAPVRRLVAVKLIKAGMDSRQVIARFEAERQALALMDHANIARVLDAGTTSAGRPYFVMDLVKGVPITRYCDEHRLTPQQRLELFIPVCQAIQHAHQKGIIHRDLKPSNVVVALYDGKPVPKVIDFGVAKATGPPLTEKTLVTGFGSLVGTLEYMSPEQAELNQLDIDTRSDIYSLGVLLYELLAGSPPFSRKDLETGGVMEMLRVIREQEPTKPSTKLSTADALPTLAANRGTEPARLTKLVRGEPDWIVMKCLEKNRNRRYDTANGLAMDIRRYLDNEPVQACPPSTAYRFRKFARRNRGPVLAGALVVLALVVGIIGTSLGLWQANEAREEAEGQTALANAVKGFLEDDVLLLADPATQQQDRMLDYDANVKLRDVVLRAAERIEGKFADRPLVEAEIRNTLGFTLLRMGRADLAVRQCVRARELYTQLLGPDHRDTIRSTDNLANSYDTVGRHADALKLREETFTRQRQKLGPDHPHTLATMNNLAITYAAVGRRADALKLLVEALTLSKQKLGPDHPETLASMSNLANTYVALGRRADALKLREETLTLLKHKLGPDHPETLGSMSNLANSYSLVGRYADGLKLHDETLKLQKQKLGPDHPDTLMSMHGLAISYADLGRHADALKLREETLTLQKQKLGPDHPDTLRTMGSLAHDYTLVGRYADGLKLHKATLSLSKQKLGPDHPDTLVSMNGLAISYAAVGRHADALKLREETLTLQKQKIGPDHPDTLQTMGNLANSYSLVGRYADGLKLQEETLSLQKQKLGPDHPDTLRSMNNLAITYAAVGRHADALKLREETLTLLKQKLGPDHPVTLRSMNNLASRYRQLGRYADALKLSEDILSLRMQNLGPDHPDTLLLAGEVISELEALKRPDEALPRIDALLALADKATLEGKRVDPGLALRMLLCRLRTHQDKRDAAGCRATAAMWEQRKPADASSMYQAARFWALTAAVQAKQPAADAVGRATKDADRAMTWLVRAVAAGFADGATLEKDRDFDPLRQREDFKRLLTELQATKK